MRYRLRRNVSLIDLVKILIDDDNIVNYRIIEDDYERLRSDVCVIQYGDKNMLGDTRYVVTDYNFHRYFIQNTPDETNITGVCRLKEDANIHRLSIETRLDTLNRIVPLTKKIQFTKKYLEKNDCYIYFINEYDIPEHIFKLCFEILE